MSIPERAQQPQPPRDLADWQWAAILSVVAVGYYLVLIDAGTTFFSHTGAIGGLTAAQVWGVAALLVLQSLFVFLRRWPVIMFAAVILTLYAAMWVIADRNLLENLTLLFAVFTLTSRVPAKVWIPALAIAFIGDLAMQLVTTAVELHAPLTAYVWLTFSVRALISYLVAMPIGLLVRALERHARLAAAYSASVEREHAAALSATIANERTRMARELHDVATYRFSEVLLKTTTALRLLHTDPLTSERLLESVRAEGDKTLTSLREVIGVLRDRSDEDTGPTLDTLPELIESVRAVHPAIELTVDGRIDDLSAGVSLACYRIMQESLTNAMRHAPGSSITMTVERSRDAVTLSVRNSAATRTIDAEASRGGGYGLVGMKERVSLLGGALTSQADGAGWLTRAEIPLGLRTAA